jgi:hypothetical protein
MSDGGINEIVETAIECVSQLVHRETDAVVGDSVLAKVIGTNLF